MTSVSSEELTEQLAFDALEPDDPWLMVAMVCWTIASFSGNTKKRYKVSEFYVPSMQQDQTGRSLFNQLKGGILKAGG